MTITIRPSCTISFEDTNTIGYYVCWTINRTREMRHLMRLGVSGILTDFPTLLRRLLNRKIRQDARRAARSARQHARGER